MWYTFVERPAISSSCHPQESVVSLFGGRVSLFPDTMVDYVTSEPRGNPPVSSSPVLGLQVSITMPGFADTDSGNRAQASTMPARQSFH